MFYYHLSILPLLVVLGGCKQKFSDHQLSDYSPFKTEYLAKITGGRTYVETFGEAADPAAAGANDVGQIREKLEDSDYKASIEGDIRLQLKYIMNAMTAGDAAVGLRNAKITTLSVPDQEPLVVPASEAGAADPELPELDGDKKYVMINFDAEFPALIDSSAATTAGMEAWTPKFPYSFDLEEVLTVFKSCVQQPAAGTEIDMKNLFYYLRPTTCAFSELNKNEKYFLRVMVNIHLIGEQEDPGSPKYDQMWSDNKLVMTYIFGRSDQKKYVANDHGTKAFNDFQVSLKNVKNVSITNKTAVSKNNIYYEMAVLDAAGKKTKRTVSVQVIHLPHVPEKPSQSATGDPLAEAVAKEIDPKRAPSTDVFMYNGHGGYGNNVASIQKILNPQEGHYLLLYLNGCKTYSYADFNDSETRILTNGKDQYFTQMAPASISMLQNLVAGEKYENILASLPQDADPILGTSCSEPPN